MNVKIIFFSLLFFIIIIFPDKTNAALTDGLVGYWPFDESSGAVASDF